MIQILANCDTVSSLVTMKALKKILSIIQIIGPIVLIVALTFHITQLVMNPDDKKILKKILISILATVIIFFIPLIVNVVMGWMDNATTFSACWNSIPDD